MTVICEKHGKEWMDEFYDGPGGYCLGCDEIIEENVSQSEEGINPLHAKNNPLPTLAEVVEAKVENIHLDFGFGKFSYTSPDKEIQGDVSGKFDEMITKARENAQRLGCKLMISELGKVFILEDYR